MNIRLICGLFTKNNLNYETAFGDLTTATVLKIDQVFPPKPRQTPCVGPTVKHSAELKKEKNVYI